MIFIAGANDSIQEDAPLLSRFEAIGFNTGNAAIARGVRDLLRSTSGQEIRRYTRNADVQAGDLLVIAAANWISVRSDLSWLLESPGIHRFRRVAVLGLGIQSDISRISEASRSVHEFIEFLASRHYSVGVRDRRSQKLLAERLDRVFWTGCPSLRINCSEYRGPRDGVAAGTSIEVIGHAHDKSALWQFERSVVSGWAHDMTPDSLFLQAELPAIRKLAEKDANGVARYFKAYIGLDIPSETIDLKRIECHFSVDQWLDRIKTKRAYVGTRLHGNILAWKSGCLPFLIAHDSRTKAFLEDFCFPGADVSSVTNVQRAMDMAESWDMDRFQECLAETQTNLTAALNAVN